MAKLEQPVGFQRMDASTAVGTRVHSLTQASDVATFEELFEAHWASICRMLAGMVGDPSEAQDLALETFYRLYERTGKTEEDFNTAAWLRKVAVNLALQSMRSFKRRYIHESAEGRASLLNAGADTGPDIVAERERQALARAALARMKSHQSELLLMRYSGASYAEIAEALRVSPTSIGPLLLRAEREFSRVYRKLAQEET